MAPEPATLEEPRPAASVAVVEPRYPLSKRPWLGVEIEDQPDALPGVRVVRVLRGSPAADVELRPGDELLSVGGARLDSPSDLPAVLGRLGVGAEAPLSVKRGGEHRIFRALLRGQPEFEDLLRLAFVGLEAPTISGVVTFQGEAASLSELRGKVVLLEFWASWCEVCRYLAPVLGRWQRTYRPAGLEVVGVTIDPPDVAAKAALRAGMSYTLASDAGGDVSESYLASQIPAVFVINRRGVIVDVMVGVAQARLGEMHELVERLLDEHEDEGAEVHGG
jgi:peroxiredoxin